MKISTKGRYALRTMIYIAEQGEGAMIALREISESLAISVKYLEQLVSPLVSSGLLKGFRGARGGYSLNRPASEITAGDIIRISETSIAPVACLEEDFGVCPRRDECETLDFWKGLDDVVESYMDSISLESLAADSLRKKEAARRNGPTGIVAALQSL